MAENNEFFREVAEDYRRDQIAAIWKRYSGLIIAVAVLIAAGVGGWRYWQHDQLVRAETASEQFDKAAKLAAAGSGPEADKAFEALSRDGTAGYRILARFRAAADLSKRDAAASAAEYDKLAADTALGDGLRDLARLRASLIRLDLADPAPALTSLQGLAAPTGAFRHTAREMLGLAELKRGDYTAAGRWFDQIAGDAETPQGLRQRVEVYEALVSGGPVTVTEAKPDAAAPPPMTR
ncbi:tetratricopeptide repeat protein [Methylobacterium haplocladii]|uniref:Ancillary SecYEG translocon subunit/Cell division coordinator CpoB TPR domain-containing protein n=1 Tax=Methylobacterium haplocladii TaxID=1176176 RepID=A0A512IJ16_9HYPH|nr:tetratricopeptide repeat protein [Methylobacterium haplocladii]GEO97662.1 hypothetical protein MHA02_00500 [Methylobacterium haplocladii]GJD84463.1 hypothetical protein HPGCJGGD_2340 [Methylobacterium haplocladii]GLS57392.1 hypothetical protein GCM10007887_00470 [Methylobacterium haplocladii]